MHPDISTRDILPGVFTMTQYRNPNQTQYTAAELHRLEVLEKRYRQAARNLFTRQGFKETGRIIDFFTPDNLPAEDAVIMMKPASY